MRSMYWLSEAYAGHFGQLVQEDVLLHAAAVGPALEFVVEVAQFEEPADPGHHFLGLVAGGGVLEVRVFGGGQSVAEGLLVFFGADDHLCPAPAVCFGFAHLALDEGEDGGRVVRRALDVVLAEQGRLADGRLFGLDPAAELLERGEAVWAEAW